MILENNIDILIDLQLGWLNMDCVGHEIYYEFEFYPEILN